jgi:ankyrin repeat protein
MQSIAVDEQSGSVFLQSMMSARSFSVISDFSSSLSFQLARPADFVFPDFDASVDVEKVVKGILKQLKQGKVDAAVLSLQQLQEQSSVAYQEAVVDAVCYCIEEDKDKLLSQLIDKLGLDLSATGFLEAALNSDEDPLSLLFYAAHQKARNCLKLLLDKGVQHVDLPVQEMKMLRTEAYETSKNALLRVAAELFMLWEHRHDWLVLAARLLNEARCPVDAAERRHGRAHTALSYILVHGGSNGVDEEDEGVGQLLAMMIAKGSPVEPYMLASLAHSKSRHLFDTVLDKLGGPAVLASLPVESHPLFSAVNSQDEAFVRYLCKDIGIDRDIRDKNGDYSINIAARATSFPNMLRELVDSTYPGKPANINAQDREYGFSPLMSAVVNQSVEALDLLASLGADASLQNRYGENVLMLARKRAVPEHLIHSVEALFHARGLPV